jgi:hypothetical protein
MGSCGEISVCTPSRSTWSKVLRLYYLVNVLGSQDSPAAVVSMLYDSVLYRLLKTNRLYALGITPTCDGHTLQE